MSRKILTLIIFAVAFAPLSPAQSNWSGNMDVSFGSNFHSTMRGSNSQHKSDIGGKASLKTEKFTLDMSLNGSYSYIFSGMLGLTLKTENDDTTGTVDASANETENRLVRSHIGMGWSPSKRNIFNIAYDFSHNNSTPTNYTLSTDRLPDGTKKAVLDYARENSGTVANRHDINLNYIHNLHAQGKFLRFDVNGNRTFREEYSLWNTGISTVQDIFDQGVIILETYRSVPSQSNRELQASALFSDNRFAGIRDLKIDFSLKAQIHKLEDHIRNEDLIDGEWVSGETDIENFAFNTSSLTPKIKLGYKIGRYTVDASFSPEFYLRKLDSEGHIGDIDKGAAAFPFHFGQTLEPWKGHTFSMSLDRSESRPSYLQICWFPRIKSIYANEYYMGNSDLKNSKTAKGNLSYKFKSKRLSTTINYGHIFKRDKIEQTYNTETIDDKKYRIYTWINGGYSHEDNVTLSVSWAGKNISASAQGTWNYYLGVKNNGKETRSSDFNVSANATYILNAWKFSAAADYQSDVIRSYQSITSIIGIRARIERKFEKSTLFIEGRNLADQPIRVITMSEDGTEKRIEETRNNLRLFTFGAHFDF